MKRLYSVAGLTLLFVVASLFRVCAQEPILDPNDTIVIYDPNTPPIIPPNNSIPAKWVMSQGNYVKWNTSQWKAYYYNGTAIRILFPKDYLSNPTKTFPLVLFLHGDGEKGTIYDNQAQLYHCAQQIQNAENNGTFDGFAVFPQNTSGVWYAGQLGTIKSFIEYMIQNARVDRFRISLNGLSGGGGAVDYFTQTYPKLVAASIPMSPTNSGDLGSTQFIDSVKDIPFWISQGGQDANPNPITTTAAVQTMVNAGMDIRSVGPKEAGLVEKAEGYYTLYPTNGHNTWDAHYQEPLVYSFMLTASKSNPHVVNGRRQFCPGTPINVTLQLTPGFTSYEWKKNGTVIAGANSNSLVVTDTGTYSARVLDNAIWSDWSLFPAQITYSTPTNTPPIQVSGLMSSVIPAPDGNNSVTLTEQPGYSSYQWMDSTGKIVGTSREFTASAPGSYTAIVTELYGCSAVPSAPFYVASNTGPNPPSIAANLTGYALTSTSIRLNWSQNLHPINKQTAFEIYRSKTTGGPYTLVGLVHADTLGFTDEELTAGTKYYYAIRAIDSTSAANLSAEDSISTIIDKTPPSAPGNLQIVGATDNAIRIGWQSSTDNIAVKNYYVYVNGVRTFVTPNTSFTLNNLTYQHYYTLTVKAVDSSGNVSSPSNQVVASATDRGLRYYYYTFTGTWSKLPDLSTLSVADSGIINNISLTPAEQPTNYALAFKGYINIISPGTYTFYTSSDDGSTLYINGTKVVNNDGPHGTTQVSGTYTFTQAGRYPFEVDYFQQGGGVALTVSWKASSAGISMSQIPDSAFLGVETRPENQPAKPTGIAATAISYNQIKLNWTDNSNNETGFEIYRGNSVTGPWQGAYTTKANITAYNDSALTPNTHYFYKIQAINQFGSSGFSPQTKFDSATTFALPPAPSAPSNLTATTVSSSQINLHWDLSADDITEYNVFRSDGNDSSFRQLTTLPSGNSSYIDSSLFSITTYYYKLSAINIGGSSNYSNHVSATTLNQPPIITKIDDRYIPRDTTTKIAIKAIDPNGGLLIFSAENLPVFGSLEDNGDRTATLSFSPSTGQGGVYKGIKAYVIDQYGGKDSTIFNLSVGDNQLPVIRPIAPIQANTFNLVSDTIFVTDQNSNSSITWKLSNMPSFIDTVTDSHGNLILHIYAAANNIGNYSFQVTARDNYGGQDQKSVNITVTYTPPQKWYINFASGAGWLTYPTSPWNNVRTDTAENLKDSDGNASTLGMRLNTGSWPTRNTGVQTGNNSGVYPDLVLRDYYYFGIWNTVPTLTGAITGLDTLKTYTITFFGSSDGQVVPSDGYTVYQVDKRKDSLQALGNTKNTVTISNISPALDGTIAFTISKGAGASAGFINAIVVSTDTINNNVRPSVPQEFQASSQAAGGKNEVTLSWKLGTGSNAKAVEVYRSTSKNGIYMLLNPDTQNGFSTSYTDANVLFDSTYYYYLTAKNAFGSSPSSDTVSITIPQYIDNRKWYINYAMNAGWLKYPGSPWNNMLKDTITNLTDDKGNSSHLGIQLNTNLWPTRSTGAQTGNDGGIYPDMVLRDYYYFGIWNTPQILTGSITGLDTLKTYSITFFGSSDGQIVPSDGYTVYQAGQRKDSIQVLGNTQNTVTISNISPAQNGSIAFTVSKGSGASAGFINAMVVSTDTIDNNVHPATPLNLQANSEAAGGRNQVNLNWQLGSGSNAKTIAVYRSDIRNGTYTLLDPDTLNGFSTNYIDKDVSFDSTYYYYLVAINAFGSSSSSDTVSITIPKYIDDRKWYVNYAMNAGWLKYPSSPWNNMLKDTITNLNDDKGNSSPVGIQLNTNLWPTRSTGAQTGNNSGVYPDMVLRDYYYFGIWTTPPILTGSVTGLDTSKTYSITFFASSDGQIVPSDGYTIYQVGDQKDSIQVLGNINNTATIEHVTPATNGTISFTVSKGSGASAGFINAMVINTDTNFPPATPINFALKNKIINSKSAVSINWAPGSNNTDTVEIFRSTSRTGTYVQINPGVNNGDSINYSDTDVTLGETYFYYLTSSNAYGTSHPSDTLSTTVISLIPSTPEQVELRNVMTSSGGPSVVLNWKSGSINADSTKIFRAINQAGDYTLLESMQANSGVLSYIDSTVSLNSTYYYYLQSANAYGNSDHTDTLSTTVVALLPATPILSGIKNDVASGGKSSVVINWQTESPNTDTILVYRSTAKDSIYILLNKGMAVGSNTSFTDNDVYPNTAYYYYLIAAGHNGNSSSSDTVSITTSTPTENHGITTIKINFNGTNNVHLPWNNTAISAPKAGYTITNLRDTNNVATGVNLSFGESWSGSTINGAVTGDNSGIYPDSVMQTGYWDNTSNEKHIIISGLSSEDKYNISIFGSITSSGVQTAIYTINGHSDSSNVANNTSEDIAFLDLLPDSTGSITVKINKGPNTPNSYLNAMVIQGYDTSVIPPPYRIAATSNSRSKITLTWKNNTDDMTGSEIWRSNSANGIYTRVASLPGDTEGYTDTNLASNTRYFYKLKTLRQSDSSALSTSASATTLAYAVYINFDQNTPVPAPWNNTDMLPDVGNTFTLTDEVGHASGITLEDYGGFSGVNPWGVITGNNSGIYPDNAIGSTYWVDAGDTGRLVLSGLDLSKYYDLTFFGSRTGTTGTDRTTIYLANGQKTSLQATNNSTQTATIYNVSPDTNGDINIGVTNGGASPYGYIGTLVIQAHNNYDDSGKISVNPILYMVDRDLSASKTKIGLLKANTVEGSYTLQKAYPNPFNTYVKLVLSCPQSTNLIISLINSNGVTLDRQVTSIAAGTSTIAYRPTQSLSPGLYIVRIYSTVTKKSTTVKLIKQ